MQARKASGEERIEDEANDKEGYKVKSSLSIF